MPISRDEFESRLDRPLLVVLDFLRRNMESAYTVAEITDELTAYDDVLTEAGVQRALDELAARERVETSIRGGEVYYAYRRWLGLRRR